MIFPDLLISINAHVCAERRSQLIDLPTGDDFQINRQVLGFGFNTYSTLHGSLWSTGAFSHLSLTFHGRIPFTRQQPALDQIFVYGLEKHWSDRISPLAAQLLIRSPR